MSRSKLKLSCFSFSFVMLWTFHFNFNFSFQSRTMAEQQRRRRLIVDCDAGVDDCQALLMALTAHIAGKIELVGITCVSGNVHVDKVIKNVRRCVAVMMLQHQKLGDQANREKWAASVQNLLRIPILRGCHEPLIVEDGESLANATFWHGKDGLGNKSKEIDAALSAAGITADLFSSSGANTHQHAVQAMIEMCASSPGEVTICALGPLTNIAMACKLSESFSTNVKHLIFMGGSRFARGNANLTAEFNAFADPESFQIVLRHFRGKATMIGWDLTVKHGVPFEFVKESWMGSASDSIYGLRPAASFLSICSADIIQKSQTGPWGGSGLLIPDPLAMVVALEPSVVLSSIYCWATVETSGKRTKGMLVIDYDDLFAAKRRECQAAPQSEDQSLSWNTEEKKLCIVTELDMACVHRWLLYSTETPSL